MANWKFKIHHKTYRTVLEIRKHCSNHFIWKRNNVCGEMMQISHLIVFGAEWKNVMPFVLILVKNTETSIPTSSNFRTCGDKMSITFPNQSGFRSVLLNYGQGSTDKKWDTFICNFFQVIATADLNPWKFICSGKSRWCAHYLAPMFIDPKVGSNFKGGHFCLESVNIHFALFLNVFFSVCSVWK